MYTAQVQNASGNLLELTHNEANWQIVSITGLNPPTATINTSTMALWDGAKFNSARLNTRNIVITLQINTKVEENRHLLYQYFQTKNWCKFFFQNENRNVFIEGYVETIECDLFSSGERMQISMICPSPYFKAAQEIINELDSVTNMFHFPFSSGGGKNLLQNTAVTTTTNGITFTVNPDGSVTANGTATANAYLILGSVTLDANIQYALSGCPSGGGNSTYRLYWQGVTGNYDEGNGATYTPSSKGDVNIRIVVYSGATINNLTFYPMVRLSSITDDAYEQYQATNIVFGYYDSSPMITILNSGYVTSGCIFTLYATNGVSNPKIFNYDTGEFIGLNYTMQVGDEITINTNKGEKTVTLLRNGVTTNLFNYLMKNSTWLQLESGETTFTYEVGSGHPHDVYISITHNDLFEGV